MPSHNSIYPATGGVDNGSKDSLSYDDKVLAIADHDPKVSPAYSPQASPDVDVVQGHHSQKVLKWYDLIGLGVGCVIGAGIFVTTGSVFANVTGPAIIISYIVAGTCCAFACLCYSEFAAMSPNSGSAYAFTRQTMGEYPAMMVGWNLALEYSVSAGTVTQGFSSYFQAFVALCGGNIYPRRPDLNLNASGAGNSWISYTFWDYVQGQNAYITGSAIDLWATLLALVLGLLVAWGISESKNFNNSMVVIKLVIVFIIIGLGGYYNQPGGYTPFAPYGYGGLQFFGNVAFGDVNSDGAPIGMLAGASTVFFAYIGFDAVTATCEEAVNPQRDLPIGLLGSLTISTALYIAVCLVLSGMIPFEWYGSNGGQGLADRGISTSSIFSDIFVYYGATWAAWLICIGAMVGLTSVTLVTMIGQPRIFMSMARDGLLPGNFFGHINSYTRTPLKSCIFFAFFTAFLSAILPGNVLLSMTNIGTLFAFTFVCLSLPIYRYINPDRPRPFRAPLSDWRFPLVPVLGAGLSIILAFSLDSQNWYRLLGWMAAGTLIYFLWGRKNAKRLREQKASLPTSMQYSQGSDAAHSVDVPSTSLPAKEDSADGHYVSNIPFTGAEEYGSAIPVENHLRSPQPPAYPTYV